MLWQFEIGKHLFLKNVICKLTLYIGIGLITYCFYATCLCINTSCFINQFFYCIIQKSIHSIAYDVFGSAACVAENNTSFNHSFKRSYPQMLNSFRMDALVNTIPCRMPVKQCFSIILCNNFLRGIGNENNIWVALGKTYQFFEIIFIFFFQPTDKI